MLSAKSLRLVLRSLRRTLYEFSVETQVHGIKYVSKKNTTAFEKICWFIIVLLGIVCASIMVNTFWDRYISNPTSIVVETNHASIGLIPFPGVTICNTNRIHRSYVKTFVKKLNLPENVTREDIQIAIENSGVFLTEFNYTDIDLLEEILQDNRYSTDDVMQNVVQPCRDLFVRCRWEGKIVNCKKYFKLALTTEGYCCTFNAEFRFRKFSPVHTDFFGLTNGLSVVMLPSPEPYFVTSFSVDSMKVYIHDNYALPTEAMTQKLAPRGSETAMEISARMIYCTQQVRDLAISDRQCVFNDERPLPNFARYSIENCATECRANKALDLCGCVPYYYPSTPGVASVCNFTRSECLMRHLEEFRNIPTAPVPRDHKISNHSSVCLCPQLCNSFKYEVHAFSTNLVNMDFNVDQFYRDLNGSHSVLHIYFRKQTTSVHRRDLLSSWIGLVSSLGGIFGLFLGCSFLSGLEILYFLSVRLIIIYKRLKEEENDKVLNQRKTMGLTRNRQINVGPLYERRQNRF